VTTWSREETDRNLVMSMIVESSASDPGWWRLETGTEPEELPAPDAGTAA
jgi:hypothetical protein